MLYTTAVTFTHDPDRPHQIDWSAPPGSASAYAYETGGAGGDGNGGLASRPATAGGDAAKSVLYDVEGRVQRITVGGNQVESVYDDAGQRIARIVNGTEVTLFFGRYVEVRGGTLTRHVFAGARRIAFSAIAAPPTLTLAALPDDHPEVRLARAAAEAAWVASLPGPGRDPGPLAAAAGTAVLLVGTLVLIILPTGRRRLGVLGVVHRGRVGALVVLYVVSLPPWPERHGLAPRPTPVAAQCEAPPASPASTVHVDHLGSTTLLTNYGDGAVQQYYRYGAYGRMHVMKPDGTQAAAGTELTELTYTGQRWDAHARSYYYGARHYDPAIGRFLTIDPARQFANPYTYVGWRPTMLVDPTGRDAYTFALLTGNDLAESYQTYGMIPGGSTTHGVVGLDGAGNQQVSLALGGPDPGGISITAILFGANASAEGPAMSSDRSNSAGPSPGGGSPGAGSPAPSHGAGGMHFVAEALARGLTYGLNGEVDALVGTLGGKFGGTFQLFSSPALDGIYTYSPAGENYGLMIGGSITVNAGFGIGSYEGTTDAVDVSIGPVTLGVYWTPGALSTGQGYFGLTFGAGWGPPGVGITSSNYQR